MYLDATKKLAESSGRIRFAKGAELFKNPEHAGGSVLEERFLWLVCRTHLPG